jgi:hypothetical protein
MFETSVVEKIKTHLMFSPPPPENRAVYEIMWEKCCRAGQAADDNMADAHCTLDTWGYEYTLRICNTYCFSTATMVARTRLFVNIFTYIAWPVYVYLGINKLADNLGSQCVLGCYLFRPCWISSRRFVVSRLFSFQLNLTALCKRLQCGEQ